MNAVNVTPGTAGVAVKDTGILYPLMLVAAVGVIVFSIAGIATMMGWMPGVLTSGTKPVARLEAPQQSAPRGVAPASACRDCGIVESLRVVEAPGESSDAGAFAVHESGKRASRAVHFEIRVRMSDGASRTLYERTRPALTVGQKVRVTEQGVMAAG
jgi:outer membrane lipoprotein SlyB